MDGTSLHEIIEKMNSGTRHDPQGLYPVREPIPCIIHAYVRKHDICPDCGKEKK